MAEPYSTMPSRRRMSMRTLLGLAIAAFLLGGIATWVLAGSPGLSSFELFTVKKEEAAPAPARPTPTATLAQTVPAGAAEQIEEVAQQQGGLDQRVAAMEQRLSRLDMQTQAAAGNAARAEGLLVAFAVRRT